MNSTVLIALLALCTVASAVDSEGTNFVFAFVRNANSDITNQVLTATVLNRNDQDCKFTLTYRPDFHKTTSPENITQTVPSLSAINVDIPSWYGWNYAGFNVQDDVYLTLLAFSTCPVTLLANNYDNVTNQGDTFMVLPSSWGAQSFTFSLPPAIISTTAAHYEQVFVLPTTEGTTSVTFVEIGNAQSVFYINATYGNSPAVYVGARTSDSRPRTYHVMSDKPVLIVAGVTCAGTDANSCDHVAYMPHPPPASDCYTYDYYDDDHISYLPTTSQFFTDIPGTCLVGQNITSTLNDGLSKTMTIKPQMESPLWTISTTNSNQLGVAFHNGGSNIHIARYYDGTKYSLRGAFIATSPSLTQFHNDYSSFYTRNVNDTVEIYCTILACASLTLDEVGVVSSAQQKITQTVDGKSFYIFTVTVTQPGFHRLDLNPSQTGSYAFFVSGKNGQYSYGYEGGVNKPTVVLAPPTSPGPSTVVTIPTGTTATPTVPTVTVPTVTVPVVTTQTNAPGTGSTSPATSPSTTSSSSPGTSKQTSAVTSQSTVTPTVSAVTVSSSSTQTSTTAPIPTPQTTSKVAVTTPSVAPTTTTQTATTATSQTQTSTSTVTSATTVVTSASVRTTTATSPPQTSATTTAQIPTSPTTSTTKGPVVTTPSPLVTTSTTPNPSPQTSVSTTTTAIVTPIVVTTPAQSTAGSTVTQQQPNTSPTTQAPVTTPTTPAVVTQPSTSTTTQNKQTSNTTPVTVPVVSTSVGTTSAPSTTPVTTQPTSSTTKTTTTTTTQISTTTLSSSFISTVIPIVLTIFFALF